MTKFEQFAKEKQYLLGVSPRTIEWYQQSLRWLSNESPSEQDLKDTVLRMRTAGLKPSSCNSHIRAINSYLHWNSNAGSKCSPSCPHPKISRLKEPSRTLPTFSQPDIQRFLSWRPKTFTQRRLQCLLLMLADTGARIGEALSLRWSDVDWDSMLLTLHGKGAKDRRVPFSQELRRFLWKLRHEHQLVFCARHGGSLGRRDVLRDTKRLCRDLGIKVPERTLHSFRHSFAMNYLRKGGSTFHLQKVLGHSSLEMTKKYCSLLTEDLQRIHQQVSLLTSS